MFRFQIEVAPGSWRDIGSASVEGEGVGMVGAAILELMEALGGTLEAGEYRYRPLDGVTHEWSSLTLDATWAGRPTTAAQRSFPISPLG